MTSLSVLLTAVIVLPAMVNGISQHIPIAVPFPSPAPGLPQPVALSQPMPLPQPLALNQPMPFNQPMALSSDLGSATLMYGSGDYGPLPPIGNERLFFNLFSTTQSPAAAALTSENRPYVPKLNGALLTFSTLAFGVFLMNLIFMGLNMTGMNLFSTGRQRRDTGDVMSWHEVPEFLASYIWDQDIPLCTQRRLCMTTKRAIKSSSRALGLSDLTVKWGLTFLMKYFNLSNSKYLRLLERMVASDNCDALYPSCAEREKQRSRPRARGSLWKLLFAVLGRHPDSIEKWSAQLLIRNYIGLSMPQTSLTKFGIQVMKNIFSIAQKMPEEHLNLKYSKIGKWVDLPD